MILLNNDSVNFKTFPNNEHRLDLDVNHLSNENTVVWHYKTDASIFKLLLFNKSMVQLNQTYELVIAYMPYSRMDRIQEENTAFSLELLVDVLSSQLSTVTKIYIFDPHSPVTLERLKPTENSLISCLSIMGKLLILNGKTLKKLINWSRISCRPHLTMMKIPTSLN